MQSGYTQNASNVASKRKNKKTTGSSGSSACNKDSNQSVHRREKYVPVLSLEGQQKLEVKLPGSHRCDCQASRHKLINNCLFCGRIVCDQEGSGPCYFCGNLVCTQKDREILNAGGKAADDLKKQLLFARRNNDIASNDQSFSSCSTNLSKHNLNFGSISEDLTKATAEKDRLLDYQRNSASRTKVYDDQSDYYSLENSQWLSEVERDKLRKHNETVRVQKELANSKLHQKLVLNLETQTVQQANFELCDLPVDESVMNLNTYDLKPFKTSDASLITDIGRLPLCIRNDNTPELIYSNNTVVPSASPSLDKKIDAKSNRLQDFGFNELQDAGLCISMHQPYASLLVRGIKKFEGRGWYIKHRGILWIASTAKLPTKADINEIEMFYRRYYNNNLPATLPEHYPTGALLGCVTVTDCFTQEQYRDLYPTGESESPYVAACVEPRELNLKFPISGRHKIYKLDSNVHAAAKKAIERDRL